MNIAVLALVGIVLILGLVAFALGTAGWNWGTVATAFLLLLSSVAFVYLAARVLERERVWGERVRSLESQLTRARDAQQADPGVGLEDVPGERSLAVLKTEVERWKRARDRSETWRGRFWENGEFQPPRVAEKGGPPAPGTLSFELADEEAEVPIAAGAQVFVFDDADVADGGRYLGAFRVEASARDGDQFRLTVVPALPQSPSDAKVWSKTYDSVTAFERLPTDSWLAFSRTSQPPAEGEEAGEEADDSAAAGDVIPPTRKMNAETLLQALESRLAEVERHDVPVPEDEWRPLVEKREIPPGLYWATVEFTQPHEVKLSPDGEPRDPVQFEPGDVAEFGLESAIGFVDAKNEPVVDIKQVVYRRPLTDAATAIQGGEVAGAGGATIRAAGLIARRAALERQVVEAKAALQALAVGLEKAKATLTTLRSEEGELVDDFTRWRKDAATAAEVATAFDQRSKAASRALDDAWGIVVQRGREYDGTMTLLQAELDKRAPAPR